MRGASWLLALCVLFASAHAAAENRDLARARVQLEGLRFDEARASLELALRAGVSGRADLVEIYRLTAQVEAVLGNSAGAELEFRKVLAIDPSFQLVAGTSPKITGPLQAAQAWFKGRQPLAARVDLPAGVPSAVLVTIDSDPVAMVGGARAVYWDEAGSEKQALGHGTGMIYIDVPGARRVVIQVVDSWGNRLVEAGTMEGPLVIDVSSTRPPAAAPPASKPFYTRSYLWYAVAVGFAAGGTWFGLAANASQDELDELNTTSAMHDFSEAKTVEDRGQRQALIANISFAAAGTFAVVGTIFLVRDLMSGKARRAPSETAVRAAPALVPGGAGLVLSGGW